MFEILKAQPADKILALMQMYKADPRLDKIDLGVGVYKDANGNTPVMRAVKDAERQLLEEQQTKSYVALAGDTDFREQMRKLVLGDTVTYMQVASVATPGGTGAVRQAFEFAHLANPDLRVFVSNPTWPNHLSILKFLGIETVQYRYFDETSCGVDFDAMMSDLSQARAGDLVLLHGCCHNPTGANLILPEWREVSELLNKTGAIPMIDIAYQGFGDGLEQDAAATRLMAKSCPQLLIAASCSKNFGVYRERTGILMAVAHDQNLINVAQENLSFLNRQNYSFPPDHGARVVTMILANPNLRTTWESELEAMRVEMLSLRTSLADELRHLTGSDRFGFLAQHRGMFSRLGATPEQVEKLRADHGIYMVGDSRFNVAGLNADTVKILANAIRAVGI